jgi:hypothetical protein
MKYSHWTFYTMVAVLVLVYFVGEATGLLFFAMLIILPGWVWLIGLLDGNNQN